MQADAQFQLIPLAQLHESPLNPRKHFDPGKLGELITSVKAHGVRTPLLVRPRPDGVLEDNGNGRPRVREDLKTPGFEIGAGHRRYRAAKAAGLEEVPAVIRPMTDAEFLELLNFENLQREDVHPLEEADGYRQLLRLPDAHYDVASIAAKVGKSVKYVYDRLKLLALIPTVREIFVAGQITAGHAILLARLKPQDQERAIDQDSGGLWQHEALLFNPGADQGADVRCVVVPPTRHATVLRSGSIRRGRRRALLGGRRDVQDVS